MEVERAGLDVHGQAALPAGPARVERRLGGQVHDIGRAAGRLGEADGTRGGDRLRAHRARCGVVARVSPSLGSQQSGAAVHDGGVLAVQKGDTSRRPAPTHGVEVPVDVAVESPEREEHLDARVASGDEIIDLGEVLVGRVAQDRMEEEVGERPSARLDPISLHGVGHGRARIRERDVADGRDAAGQRRTSTRFEVVHPVELARMVRRRSEVHVGVHSAGQHVAPPGIDLLVASHAAAELHDLFTVDTDVHDRRPPCGRHGASTHDELHRRVRPATRPSGAAASRRRGAARHQRARRRRPRPSDAPPQAGPTVRPVCASRRRRASPMSATSADDQLSRVFAGRLEPERISHRRHPHA